MFFYVGKAFLCAVKQKNNSIMEQLNRVELRGTVGSVRYQTFADASVANLTLCTNLAYKDRDGAPVIEPTWHNVVAWQGKEIQDLDKIQKGSRIHVIGRLRNRSYTGSDGFDRTIVEVVAKRLKLLTDEETFACEM